MSRGRGKSNALEGVRYPSPHKKNSKKFENPLDKRHKVWYNKDTKDKDSLKHQKGIDTMANKVTKRDNFTAIVKVLNEKGETELAKVMEHEIELLDKKNANRSSKPTNRQVENDAIKSQIVASMEPNRWYRCAEIKALIPELAEGEGTQRTARLCNDMADVNKDDKRLVRMVDKKVVYFALAE